MYVSAGCSIRGCTLGVLDVVHVLVETREVLFVAEGGWLTSPFLMPARDVPSKKMMTAVVVGLLRVKMRRQANRKRAESGRCHGPTAVGRSCAGQCKEGVAQERRGSESGA